MVVGVVVDDWILGSLERPTNRPKGADSTRRKDAGRLAGAGNCRDSGTGTVVKPTQDAKVQPLNATRNTNRPRYQQIRRGGLGYSCAVSAAFVIDGYDIDEERFVLWLALLAWRLQCFRVFRFSPSFFSFFLARTAGVDEALYRIVLTDAEISPTEHTTSQVATLATRRGAYLRFHRLNPRGNNLI